MDPRLAGTGAPRRVAVVGAGYAGMAAAVTLAGRGAEVTVFESGPVPGGRARRVRTDGRELDNGQHILVGAYVELRRLMETVGVGADALLRLPLELRYADGFVFRGARDLFASRHVGIGERLRALRFLLALRLRGFRLERDVPVAELLRRYGQDRALGHYVWRPLCVSALNTPPERASAQVFANVLRDTLAGGRGAADLLLPRVDLSRLFPEPAAAYLRAHGGELRTGTTVRDLDALRREFGRVVLAVGPHQLKTLLPGAPEFAYQPITTCYLQYPADVELPFPMLGFADGLVQWAFDRGPISGSARDERGLIACVISAEGDHQQMTQDDLAAQCHAELRAGLTGLPDPLWSRVIAEKRATIACLPGAARLDARAGEDLWLAGDYLDPEYPPTLEAAVRSGIRAAHSILETP